MKVAAIAVLLVGKRDNNQVVSVTGNDDGVGDVASE